MRKASRYMQVNTKKSFQIIEKKKKKLKFLLTEWTDPSRELKTKTTRIKLVNERNEIT